MNNFLPYLLKSTICITLLYLVFRIVMRKESFFALNRIVLLSIVITSAVIPILYLPGVILSPIQVELLPVFTPVDVQNDAIPVTNLEKPTSIDQSVAQNQLPDKSDQKMVISSQQMLEYLYLAGFLFTLLLLVRGLTTLFPLFRSAKSVRMDGCRLLVIEKEIAAFSFGRYVILSRKDYEEHRQTMLAHEQAHIRLYHFYDLLLLEIVKIFHWFNPFIHWLIRDMKEIHEFQADDYTLTKGIDATKYQLLIIQKGVGPQMFALANSFNHCQIKKRLVMMNKQKPSKAWSWKVATFLPLLALLLMAFGRKGENVPEMINLPEKITAPAVIFPIQNALTNQIIEIKKDGNFIGSKLSSLEEIAKKGKEWNKASNKWILLLIEESISLNRIDEVREALADAHVNFVTQSTVNSDDIVYFAGDVTDRAKLPQGKWSDWMMRQLNNSPEIKSKVGQYKVTYSFIVDRNGKVRDGHLIKRCDFPEVNAAYEKILTQIPDWEPARRGGAKVSVYYRISSFARYVAPPVKKK